MPEPEERPGLALFAAPDAMICDAETGVCHVPSAADPGPAAD
ncbi:hypothetical protein [Microbacterium sp. ZXX196]|nr:hypothetical protein [Microbacterium sp. ZXX196]